MYHLTYILLTISPRMELIRTAGTGRQRYNLLTTNKIAAIILIHSEEDRPSFRDIFIYSCVNSEDQFLKPVHHSHPAYMAVAYPIHFPYGETGWHWGMSFNTGSSIG
ncbi:hypothetical protein OnM2_060068 [Erysiphe neolycopersici]|uniref:Uncharacterized protein n=1 Tax=Erysiphe neolycopersici TaxID=212602 RepID=A0A420HPT7_9PEZI|nr:hypothetical protein OnM2_060068 [Erysiphe neolycopersici]